MPSCSWHPIFPSLLDASWPVLLKLFFCLIGIVSLEQVARNTRRDHEWNVKFLIIGLGAVFTYGFVLYADALLFQAVSRTLLRAARLHLRDSPRHSLRSRRCAIELIG